jgi:methionine sulfoxide reductase catalytic subunit
MQRSHNNYYEFGSSKDIAKQAQRLQIRPWSLVIDGMVAKPMTLNVDDLIKKMPLEERLLRFRCVEAWAMAVPWTGFTLKSLLALVEPQAGAKYLSIQTFNNPDVASGQKQPWYPWPYTDGLTLEEAGNDMAMLVTGVYGKPLPKQHGAPLRLITPWKYGFKQVKSIARITLTDKRPVSFWEKSQASEYGFWANINPKVHHPRWSQANEKMIDTQESRPTQLFNGYGEQVADLYKNLQSERLWA